MHGQGSYSQKMPCGSSRCLLLGFFILVLVSTAATTSLSSISSCQSRPTTAPVVYTASNGSVSTYEGPPQLTTTELYFGQIVHVTVFTLVASQIPQYATKPGVLTVITTTNAWGQETTEEVASNGWG